MKVLVVDDEPIFQEYLARSLRSEGHEVEAVGSGRAAIDHGLRFHPDVLVADWMLKDHIHGIHVAETLRLVQPCMQTILMTGFPSHDLRAEAERVGVYRFVEKPFTLKHMSELVRSTPHVTHPPLAEICLLEFNRTGEIVRGNSCAWQLLARTEHGSEVTSLATLLGPTLPTLLEEAQRGWVQVSPPTATPQTWWLRSRLWDEGGLLVLLPDEDAWQKRNPLLRLLLDLPTTSLHPWPFADQVLLIEADSLIRRAHVRQLSEAGCACYAAHTEELTLKLLRRCPSISILVVEYDLPGIDLAHLLKQIRELRPEGKIVGNSSRPARAGFARLGVTRFLQKPWAIQDLIQVLSEP